MENPRNPNCDCVPGPPGSPPCTCTSRRTVTVPFGATCLCAEAPPCTDLHCPPPPKCGCSASPPEPELRPLPPQPKPCNCPKHQCEPDVLCPPPPPCNCPYPQFVEAEYTDEAALPKYCPCYIPEVDAQRLVRVC